MTSSTVHITRHLPLPLARDIIYDLINIARGVGPNNWHDSYANVWEPAGQINSKSYNREFIARRPCSHCTPRTKTDCQPPLKGDWNGQDVSSSFSSGPLFQRRGSLVSSVPPTVPHSAIQAALLTLHSRNIAPVPTVATVKPNGNLKAPSRGPGFHSTLWLDSE